MPRILLLGAVALLSATAASASPAKVTHKPASPAETQAFDGKWSIEVVTDRGVCDRAYRYGIRIENGEARYDGSADFTVSGHVAGDGAVKGSIARGDARADVVGTLADGFGNGTWSTSGATLCGGTWNAERRS